MKYTVIWQPSAEGDLATVWTESKQRSVVSQAADRIENWLRTDPEELGESREDGERLLIESPLAVIYRLVPQDRCVFVLAVWLTTHDR